MLSFFQEIQIFKSLVLGEEERGQSQFQVMCFVTRFIKNEFISSDAMSKLRQVWTMNDFSSIHSLSYVMGKG